jgi:PAS domain S-box-containing protein
VGARSSRLQLRIGSLFLLAAVVLILPGLVLAERALRRQLLESRRASLELTMRGLVHGVKQRVAAAEARVARFAVLMSSEPGNADLALEREFGSLVRRDSDGAWRSRRESFDPVREAGIFVPRFSAVTPEFASFLMRAKHLTERFGAGTLDPVLADAWVSPVEGGQVMFVPDQPDFVYETPADQDYRPTVWIQLAEPRVNPEGRPRWAEPYHSVKSDAWYVSVVAPFTWRGRWGGSVGQDLSWQELVDYSAETAFELGGRFVLVGPNGGVILADSSTSRNPSRPGGRRLQDLADRELRDTLASLLRQARAVQDTSGTRFTRTTDAYVISAVIPRTGWLLASALPRAVVEAPLRGPLLTMRLTVLLGMAALLGASLLAITREIRRRQRIEDATRRAEERFRNLFQLSPDGVGVTLPESGRLIEVNDSFATITGYSREELIGHTTVALGLWAHPEQRQVMFEILRQQGICRNLAAVLQRKDGTRVEVTFTGRVIEVEGEPCVLSIIRDVEDQRRLERQLAHAVKMEAIGRLAGGVAHDFNNIMTAVLGYAQIATEIIPAESPAQDDLKEILRAARRASELTRQLLAFARRQVTQPKVVDLNLLVEESGKLLERLLGEDVLVSTRLAPGLPPVRVDPGQVEQVLVNLSVNARDAMPEGGTLTIATGQDGAEVWLDVIDTGVGIPLEHQGVIFEPFFTTKEQGKGTGLGLATCYGIVRQAGGRIEITSVVGEGSRFRVILPAMTGAAVDPTASEGTEVSTLAPRGGELVLLAEDEPQVRQLAHRLLHGLGYRVLVAESGEAAIELAGKSSEPIDLLLTDVVMPGMTGDQLATQLRRERPGLRVLFISGYSADSEAIERVLQTGDGFLPKPFTIATLARQVRQVLDRTG